MPKRRETRSSSPPGARYWLISRLCVLHLLVGTAVGLLVVDRRALHGIEPALILTGPIFSSTLLGGVVLLCFPQAVPGGRVEFPLNVTMPVVFALFVRASVILWTSPQSAIFQPADPLRPALAWTSWPSLGWLAAAEFAVLTGIIGLRRFERG